MSAPRRIAHVEMVGGAAGDMLLAALVDAGADPVAIEAALRTIAPDGWSFGIERTMRGGIAAATCRLLVPGEDLEPEPHVHPEDDAHAHAHEHPHRHDPHGAVSRTLADVVHLVRASGLTPSQQARAEAVYRRLASAEARVHGSSPDDVHFHEVGALDAVLDVAGTIVALDLLGVDEVTCSAFPVGRGRIRMRHGLYPNPPPASAAMLVGVPTHELPLDAELVTPTAIAILTTLVREPGRRDSMTVTAIGYGAGRRDLAIPNVVRISIGTALATPGTEPAGDLTPGEPATIAVLEANIDDMSPQHYALAVERIFAAGARDVWLVPITMKKNRPATMLCAIARDADEAAVAAAMLRETTTIGVRVRTERKYVLARRIETLATPLGAVRMKIAGEPGNERALAEHDDLVRIARETGLPLPEVAQRIQAYAGGVETLVS